MGIEPTWSAWKAGVLPLNYTRIYSVMRFKRFNILQQGFEIVHYFFEYFLKNFISSFSTHFENVTNKNKAAIRSPVH